MYKINNLIFLFIIVFIFNNLYSVTISPIINNTDELFYLQDGDIKIGYVKKEYPWCQGSMVINASMLDILDVVEDVQNYYKFFDSLSKSDINSNEEVHIRIDMPIPFDDRDYTVTFNKFKNGNEILYSFSSVVSSDFSIEKDCVRLVNAQGEWHLIRIEDNKTLVKYTWNGQMLGSFPSWAYNAAWIRQGNEILSCLNLEVERRKNDEK